MRGYDNVIIVEGNGKKEKEKVKVRSYHITSDLLCIMRL
jgi:hypothetical protein